MLQICAERHHQVCPRLQSFYIHTWAAAGVRFGGGPELNYLHFVMIIDFFSSIRKIESWVGKKNDVKALQLQRSKGLKNCYADGLSQCSLIDISALFINVNVQEYVL